MSELRDRFLLLGTRGSLLARAQALEVANAITCSTGVAVQLKTFTVSGDRKRNVVGAIRDKRDWIADIEESLLAGEIDFAVHSGKDAPVDIADKTGLIPVLRRKSANDVFISKTCLCGDSKQQRLLDLAKGACIGTSSKRRAAQLLNVRNDFTICELRGNVPTRLNKLHSSQNMDGIVVASAGLLRLGILHDEAENLEEQIFVPAVNQGILAAQYRLDNHGVCKILNNLVDKSTEVSFLAERAFIAAVGANCHSAVGVLCKENGSLLDIHAQIFSPDGSELIEGDASGNNTEPIQLGKCLADNLLVKGAARLLCE